MDNSFRTYFEHMQRINPAATEAFLSKTEEDFGNSVIAAVAWVVALMEEDAPHLNGSHEVKLTTEICRTLKASGLPASAEEYSKGHVDVTIAHPNGKPFKVIGECKKWNSPSNHVKGCGQIIMYSTGRHRVTFCMEFFDKPGMYDFLHRLRQYFDEHKPLIQIAESEEINQIRGAFRTYHQHDSGAVIEISHMGCNLSVSVSR